MVSSITVIVKLIIGGRKIFAIGTDDNHNSGDDINESPRIFSLYYDPETKTVHIKTTEAKRISLLTNTYDAASKWAKYGETITEASFNVFELADYFRLEITDKNGNKTYTNAYFTKDY